MKIISKFKDYYDIGLSYGDDDTIYVRNSQEITFKLNKERFYDWKSNKIELTSFRQLDVEYGSKYYGKLFKAVLIGFCGKIYPCVHVYESEFNNKPKNFYDYGSFNQFCKEHEIENTKRSMMEKYSIENFFNGEHPWNDLNSIFIDHNCPIFVYAGQYERDSKSDKVNVLDIVINSELKKYEFYKVFDSNSAYQELAMYVGGVLRKPTNTIIEISDKDRIKQHGFDPLYGFRKMPEKNK